MNRRLLRRAGLLALPATLVVVLSVSRGDAAAPAADPQAGPIAARAAACLTFSATNASLQTRVVTSNDPRVSVSTGWTNLECGSFLVSVPRGRHGLATVSVDAEVTCTGVDGQWCLGRVLIGGFAGQPSAPEPDSFAWANSEPNSAQWESNAFTRTRLLTCPRALTTAPCLYSIVVQVRNHAAGLTFRIDDSTVQAQLTYY